MCCDPSATLVEAFDIVETLGRSLDQLLKGEKWLLCRGHRLSSVCNVAGKLVEIIARVTVKVKKVFNLCLQPRTVFSFTRLLAFLHPRPTRVRFLGRLSQYLEREKTSRVEKMIYFFVYLFDNLLLSVCGG